MLFYLLNIGCLQACFGLNLSSFKSKNVFEIRFIYFGFFLGTKPSFYRVSFHGAFVSAYLRKLLWTGNASVF